MKLMTKEVEKKLKKFPYGSQDGKGKSAKVLVKYFNPCGAGTWLVTEGEQTEDGDWLLFGYVTLGYGWEWGSFMLSELESVKLPYGLKIERDLYTSLTTVGEMLN